ncbi:MAG: hypothetical protein JRK53_13175, partial [Deltaproteobacteria bacterium]|nr:hypothetical protein [Deltaproteobacteria bacterium]
KKGSSYQLMMAGFAAALTTKTGKIGYLGSGKLNLLKGPLNYQDGQPFLKTGEAADNKQIWFMEQLLEGMSGQSRANKSN